MKCTTKLLNHQQASFQLLYFHSALLLHLPRVKSNALSLQFESVCEIDDETLDETTYWPCLCQTHIFNYGTWLSDQCLFTRCILSPNNTKLSRRPCSSPKNSSKNKHKIFQIIHPIFFYITDSTLNHELFNNLHYNVKVYCMTFTSLVSTVCHKKAGKELFLGFIKNVTVKH